jgi:hypothetical protein
MTVKIGRAGNAVNGLAVCNFEHQDAKGAKLEFLSKATHFGGRAARNS